MLIRPIAHSYPVAVEDSGVLHLAGVGHLLHQGSLVVVLAWAQT